MAASAMCGTPGISSLQAYPQVGRMACVLNCQHQASTHVRAGITNLYLALHSSAKVLLGSDVAQLCMRHSRCPQVTSTQS